MSLRCLWLAVLVVSLGCGGGNQGGKVDGPTTAREKQLLEAQKSGEDDAVRPGSKSWGRWRYKGDRDNCFFVFGSRCFGTEEAACKAARCKKGTTCTSTGAAPATVSCTKAD
jgi:hypothetical protein